MEMGQLTRIALLFTLLTGAQVGAQTGIGNASPIGTLQVSTAGTYEGVMAPRITYAQLAAKTAYGSNQTGAILFVTDGSNATTTGAVKFVSRPGLYSFDGTYWRPLSTPRVYIGKCYLGDRGYGAGSLTVTGDLVSASKVAGAYDLVTITHNLNLSGRQFIKVSYLSNSTNDINQLNNDNNMLEPIVVDVTANGFKVFMQELNDVVQNLTLQVQIVEY